MIQKFIRAWNSITYTTTEGDTHIQELNDRTKYDVDGYNSISELGPKVKASKDKTDLITVTTAINLDDLATQVSLNVDQIELNRQAIEAIGDGIIIPQVTWAELIAAQRNTGDRFILTDSAYIGQIEVGHGGTHFIWRDQATKIDYVIDIE